MKHNIITVQDNYKCRSKTFNIKSEQGRDPAFLNGGSNKICPRFLILKFFRKVSENLWFVETLSASPRRTMGAIYKHFLNFAPPQIGRERCVSPTWISILLCDIVSIAVAVVYSRT
jgi:hypothetical protein